MMSVVAQAGACAVRVATITPAVSATEGAAPSVRRTASSDHAAERQPACHEVVAQETGRDAPKMAAKDLPGGVLPRPEGQHESGGAEAREDERASRQPENHPQRGNHEAGLESGPYRRCEDMI